MRRAIPTRNNLAMALVACEAKAIGSSHAEFPAGCSAIEKLRPHLASLMGNAGLNALINRARALGSSDVQWLGTTAAKMQGSLEELHEVGSQLEADEFSEGCIILLSHLLGLLATFIGQDLTLRIVREIWPELSPDEPDVGKGEKNEKKQ